MSILISITSAEVRIKINEWHRHIQKFNVTDAEMLKAEIERDRRKKLDNMRAYYYNFFRGMYEFRNGEYTKAITYYKKAERKIPTISAKIEKAEFYFKLSEVYYHMKRLISQCTTLNSFIQYL